MNVFKDHFSAVAGDYAAARPEYPSALFDWIASVAPSPGLCWEAGCGSGQATRDLAARFGRVNATDPSAAQIALVRRNYMTLLAPINSAPSIASEMISGFRDWTTLAMIESDSFPRDLGERLDGWETTAVRFASDLPLHTGWGKRFQLGPGNIRVAHTLDERISRDELEEGVRAYMRICRQLAGTP